VSVAIFGRKIYCANVGDSRAIKVKIMDQCKGIEVKQDVESLVDPLSRDHKPEDPGEAQRVLAAGGRIGPFKD